MTTQVLTAVDRSGLIDDAFALARYRTASVVAVSILVLHWLLLTFHIPFSSGYPRIRIDVPLKLVEHLGTELETSYVPWSTAMSWLRAIGTQLQYSPVFGEFKVCNVLALYQQTQCNLATVDLHFRNKLYKSSSLGGASFPGILQGKVCHIMTCELWANSDFLRPCFAMCTDAPSHGWPWTVEASVVYGLMFCIKCLYDNLTYIYFLSTVAYTL